MTSVWAAARRLVDAERTACTCTGCLCGRQSAFRKPCHPCVRGRHAKALVRRKVRREAERARMILAVARQRRPEQNKLAPNHAAMLGQPGRTGRRG